MPLHAALQPLHAGLRPLHSCWPGLGWVLWLTGLGWVDPGGHVVVALVCRVGAGGDWGRLAGPGVGCCGGWQGWHWQGLDVVRGRNGKAGLAGEMV